MIKRISVNHGSEGNRPSFQSRSVLNGNIGMEAMFQLVWSRRSPKTFKFCYRFSLVLDHPSRLLNIFEQLLLF